VRDWTADDPEVFSVHIVHDVIRTIVQATQLHATLPHAGEERVVNLLIFADDVSFRLIKPDIVERAQILSACKTFFLIELQPLFEALCVVGREIKSPVLLDERR